MNRYFTVFRKADWRRRIAPVALLLGLLAAAKLTFDASPREQPIQLQLGEQLRANLSAIRLTYMEDDEAISGTEQRFEGAAPAVVNSAPSLSPGNYDLHIELSDRSGKVTRQRRNVTVPSEGSLRIRLEDGP
jgi:hypothetical protein